MSSIKKSRAFALVILFWAAIYLPGLNSIGIKGEEVRRIMPGVNMLESGDWIVPHFNGVPYLRKPPLVNWAIAASVKTFGVRNEWTARLPSVLAMLVMGLVMIAVCEPWLGAGGALAAVLMIYTSAGIVDKGRIAEIEAIYVALFGMAISCWLAWTAQGRSRWMVWPVTGVLLGLGLLAKGPTHLAYFYAIVGFIAWRSWRQKEARVDARLASWAHVAGIAIMAGIFALWWIPYSHDPATQGASGVMARQMEQRLGSGDKGTVFINFARSLANFLPWIIGLPLFWHRRTLERLDSRDRLFIEAARWPIVFCAFVLMFVPGMLPRYTLPFVIPYAVLLALLLKARGGGEPVERVPIIVAGIAAVGMVIFGIFSPGMRDLARNFGKSINDKMPPGSTIYIFDPGVQPVVFYIRDKVLFTESVKELPADVPWLLAPDSALKLLRSRYEKIDVLIHQHDAGGKYFSLVTLHGHKAAPPKDERNDKPRPAAKPTPSPTGP